MAKEKLLKVLYKDKSLRLTEPSKEVMKDYFTKSSGSMKAAEILLSNSLLENSISQAYYSMYDMLTALFFRIGIKCENHTGSIILLQSLFGIDNSKLEFAKKERVDKQYYVDFKISKKDAEIVISIAKEFNSMLYDFIDKVTSKDITLYREKLMELVK